MPPSRLTATSTAHSGELYRPIGHTSLLQSRRTLPSEPQKFGSRPPHPRSELTEMGAEVPAAIEDEAQITHPVPHLDVGITYHDSQPGRNSVPRLGAQPHGLGLLRGNLQPKSADHRGDAGHTVLREWPSCHSPRRQVLACYLHNRG